MDKYEKLATILAENPTTSTKRMCREERIDGIRQMLEDLDRLARIDGCIAAGWAFEYINETNIKSNGIIINNLHVFCNGRIPRGYGISSNDGCQYLYKDGTVNSGVGSDYSMSFWETRELAESFLEKWMKVYG